MPLTEEQQKNANEIQTLLDFLTQYYAGYTKEKYKAEEIAVNKVATRRFLKQADYFKNWVIENNIKPSTGPEQKTPRPTKYDVFKIEIQKKFKELTDTKSVFSRDSDEFKRYYAALKELNDAFNKPYDKITPEDSVKLSKLADKVADTAYSYKTVRTEKNKTNPSKRANDRLAVTEGLDKILIEMNRGNALAEATQDLVDERARVYRLTTKLEKDQMAAKIHQDLVDKDPDKDLSPEKKAAKNERIFKEVNEQAAEEDAKTVKALGEDAIDRARSRGQLGKNDDQRSIKKAVLTNLVFEYQNLAKKDKELSAILNEIQKYAAWDITTLKGESAVRAEVKQYDMVYDRLLKYCDKLQDKMFAGKAKEEDDDYLRMASNMLAYFEGQRNGDLEIDESAIHVDASNRTITDNYGGQISRKNDPLFPHDPSLNDIQQGQIGDCYLVSSLSAIAMQNPDAIKQAMRDNGDGTVTVRFFKRTPEEGFEYGTKDKFEPVYVTVDKCISQTQNAKDCLWVQMFERAYAASGLHTLDQGAHKIMQYTKPVPDNIDQMYDDLKRQGPSSYPSHDECPWLIDEQGNLHKWQPKYATLESGAPGYFIESVLGENYQAESFDIGDFNSNNQIVAATIESLIDTMGGTMTPERKEQLISFSRDGVLFNNDFMFAVLNDGKDKTFNDLTGEYIAEPTELAQNINTVAEACASDFRYAIEEWIDEPNADKKRSMADAREFLDKIKSDPKFMEDNKFAKTVRENIKNGNTYVNEKIDTFIDAVSQTAKDRSLKMTYGVYSKYQKDLFNNLKKSLDNKEIITAGSRRGKSDTETVMGINKKHAYTVTGLETKTIGGKEMYFIKVRNPHGIQDVRQYDIDEKAGTIAPRVDRNVKGAESLIELNEFFRDMSHITINKKPEKDILPIKVTSEITVNEKLKGNYEKAIRDIKNAIKEEPNKSTMLGYIDQFMDIVQGQMSFCYGKDASSLPLALNHAQNTFASTYKSNQDPTIDKYLKLGLNLMKSAIEKNTNPQNSLNYSLSNKALDGIAKIAKEGGAPYDLIANELETNFTFRRKARESIANSLSFQKQYGQDYAKASMALKKSDLDLGKEFGKECLKPILKLYQEQTKELAAQKQHGPEQKIQGAQKSV